MKKFLARVFVGLLTFTFVVAISSRRFVRPHVNRSVSLFDRPQEARVKWVAENIGTVTISRSEIRSIETYDRPVGGRKGVITIGSSLNPHRTTTGLVGSSAINGVAGASVLMSYKLTVWSVTYADGKTWTRAPAERS